MHDARAYSRKRMKRVREECRKAGICSICTARKARKGLLTCKVCNEASMDRRRRRKIRLGLAKLGIE